MDKLKVLITNNQKDVKIPTGIRMLIRRCCHAVLEMENFEGSAEISVSFVNNEEIQRLNKEYRNKDAVTDVVISMPKAYEQADIYGHSLQREVGFLTVHSLLHLLGYDHEQGGLPAVQMREKEEIVLSRLGIPRGASYVFADEK